jgi:hypothetical protein
MADQSRQPDDLEYVLTDALCDAVAAVPDASRLGGAAFADRALTAAYAIAPGGGIR